MCITEMDEIESLRRSASIKTNGFGYLNFQIAFGTIHFVATPVCCCCSGTSRVSGWDRRSASQSK